MFIYLSLYINKKQYLSMCLSSSAMYLLYICISHLLNIKEHGCVIIHARAKNEGCLLYKNKEHFIFICFILNIWHWRQQ